MQFLYSVLSFSGIPLKSGCVFCTFSKNDLCCPHTMYSPCCSNYKPSSFMPEPSVFLFSSNFCLYASSAFFA